MSTVELIINNSWCVTSCRLRLVAAQMMWPATILLNQLPVFFFSLFSIGCVMSVVSYQVAKLYVWQMLFSMFLLQSEIAEIEHMTNQSDSRIELFFLIVREQNAPKSINTSPMSSRIRNSLHTYSFSILAISKSDNGNWSAMMIRMRIKFGLHI